MLSATLELQAVKSQAYFQSLCKHFARKVEVEQLEQEATVHFPMGNCLMSVDGECMRFVVHAEETEGLEKAKMIIESHALRYGELKDSQAIWSEVAL